MVDGESKPEIKLVGVRTPDDATSGGPRAAFLYDFQVGAQTVTVEVRLAAVRSSRKVVFFIAKFNKPDMAVLRELVASGRVTPVIDRRYELGEFAAALRYMGEGHARGKIVITV